MSTENIVKKLSYVTARIEEIEGIESVSVAPNGLIEVTITGPNTELREHVLDACSAAMFAAKVKYRMQDGRVLTHQELKESHSVTLPLVSFAQAAIAGLGVQGPVAQNTGFQTVFVQGGELDTPQTPPEVIARDVDGADQLKRVRANTRGKPVIGWKLGDQLVKKGTTLKITKACDLQWTFGRIVNLNAGTIANVVDIASRRPIAYVTSGEYDAIEFPIHLLGKAANIVTEPSEESCEPEDVSDKESLKSTAPDIYKLFGLRDLPSDDYSKIETLKKKK